MGKNIRRFNRVKQSCYIDSMIYTPEVRKAIKSTPVPHNFDMDIIEFDQLDQPFLLLRFYSDQWYGYNDLQRGHCAEYLQTVKDVLASYGIKASLDPCIRQGLRYDPYQDNR